MSSAFLNLVSSRFRERIAAFKSDVPYPLKYIYISGHDTTIVGYMKAILADEEIYMYLPPYASQILIELFFQDNEYWVTWEFNGQRINLSNS